MMNSTVVAESFGGDDPGQTQDMGLFPERVILAMRWLRGMIQCPRSGPRQEGAQLGVSYRVMH